MALVKGPFEIQWGANVLTDIEALDVSYEVDSEDVQTLQGKTFEVTGPHKVSATMTLLSNDVTALAVVLPQYHVANGGTMSTGETVDDENGAMDLVPGGCESEPVYNDLDIIACGATPQVFRMVNVRTEIDGIEFDNKLRKVMVKFIGEATQDEATVQFFAQGALNPVS